MRSWNLHEIEVEGGSRSPVVLDSDEAARAVFIVLEPGQSLGDHQVKEHAFVLVVDGTLSLYLGDPPERVDIPKGGLVRVGSGTPLQLVNHGDGEVLLFAYGAPPEAGGAEFLDSAV